MLDDPFSARHHAFDPRGSRSPRRPLPGSWTYWNRKGLVSDRGEKKRAFYVLKEFYARLAQAERDSSAD